MLYNISFYNFKIFILNGSTSLFRINNINLRKRSSPIKNRAFEALTSFLSHKSDHKDYKDYKNLLKLNKPLNKPLAGLLKAFAIKIVQYIKKDL